MEETITVEQKIEDLINRWETVKSGTEKEILTWETEALLTIFPHRFENIEIILNGMIQTLTKNDKFWCPGSSDPNYFDYFSKKQFNSFMDYFTRALSQEKHASILENAKSCKMVIPNECYIESTGDLLDTYKILSLKKPAPAIVPAFEKFGIDLTGYNYINQKLLLTFYHRIHSPVRGKVERIIPVPKEEGIFGENALWILDINTDFGHVYFMLVGESEIQDFHFLIKEGQDINMFDEIGNFNWGSQTVIFFDSNKLGETGVKAGLHYFAGDKIS